MTLLSFLTVMAFKLKIKKKLKGEYLKEIP
jgi:hypothetical protein